MEENVNSIARALGILPEHQADLHRLRKLLFQEGRLITTGTYGMKYYLALRAGEGT